MLKHTLKEILESPANLSYVQNGIVYYEIIVGHADNITRYVVPIDSNVELNPLPKVLDMLRKEVYLRRAIDDQTIITM